LRYVLSRLASALVVVFGVSVLVFLLIHIVPGDPVEVMLGEAAQPADREMLRESLGLDRPLLAQFLLFITDSVDSVAGRSWSLRQASSPTSCSHTACR
jgi:peptide/nickel transport system permease protein